MKIAVISDIHGNIDALNAVLADIKSSGIEEIYCTGDQVGYLPYPNEVIDTLYENKIPCIQGNHDVVIERVNLPSPSEIEHMSLYDLVGGGSKLYTQLAITEENRSYMEKLPFELVIDFEGMKVKLVHGSPDRVDEYLFEDSPRLEAVAAGLKEDVLISGHTHKPYHKVVGGKHFINAGSVGIPKHGKDLSTYVVLSHSDDEFSVEIKEVSYDKTALEEAIKKEHLISDDLINTLRNGG